MAGDISPHELDSAAKAIERIMLRDMGHDEATINALQIAKSPGNAATRFARAGLAAAALARDGKL